MRRTASQLRAEKIAALQAEQAEYDKRIQEGSKFANHARCAVVEDLYELFGIEVEQRVRQGRSGAFPVSVDRDESKRSARLLDAVGQLLERDSARLAAPLDASDSSGPNNATVPDGWRPEAA
ncbi:hypothetical protein [Microbacterium sp.]|uniref:hypothetical protein n=1 Tax=Microbacterium sp. TaxID=51671 RepID=UPI0035698D1F